MAHLQAMTDDELLASFRALEARHRETMASIIEHLVELERRWLYRKLGYPSLYEYCMAALGLSEDEAYRRIAVARMAAREPAILAGLADGSLQLSGLVALSPHFRRATPETAADLLEMARGVSRREVERRLAARFPEADAPEIIRGELGKIDPLSPGRYRVQLTIAQSTRTKLERALELMSHQNPEHALARLLDGALDALLEKLERATRAKLVGRARERTRAEPDAPPSPRPRSNKSPSRHLPRPLRRAAFERASQADGEGCCFISDDGRRCGSRHFLEIDHETPWSIERLHRAENLRVLCRAHNQLAVRELTGGAG